MHTIGLIGQQGALAEKVDVAIRVPSTNTEHIQEAHLAIEHILVKLVKQALGGCSCGCHKEAIAPNIVDHPEFACKCEQ